MMEFCLILPPMITVLGMLTMTGLLLMQFNVVTDSVRNGARMSALVSNGSTQCSQIVRVGEQEIQDSLQRQGQNGQSPIFGTYWGSPQVQIGTAQWDGYVFQTVNARLESQSSVCTFCPAGISFPASLSISTTFLLGQSCS